jgi:hypothetical protein
MENIVTDVISLILVHLENEKDITSYSMINVEHCQVMCSIYSGHNYWYDRLCKYWPMYATHGINTRLLWNALQSTLNCKSISLQTIITGINDVAMYNTGADILTLVQYCISVPALYPINDQYNGIFGYMHNIANKGVLFEILHLVKNLFIEMQVWTNNSDNTVSIPIKLQWESTGEPDDSSRIIDLGIETRQYRLLKFIHQAIGGERMIFPAAKYNNLPLIRWLMKQGLSTSIDTMSILAYGCLHGNYEMVELFIDNRSILNELLRDAVIGGNINIIQLLLPKYRSIINPRYIDIAIEAAASNVKLDILKIILAVFEPDTRSPIQPRKALCITLHDMIDNQEKLTNGLDMANGFAICHSHLPSGRNL